MLKPTDLILVCLLPTPRDLEIARLLGWYRIPLRSAPKVVALDYLAFYQMFRKAPCISSGDVRNGFACILAVMSAQTYNSNRHIFYSCKYHVVFVRSIAARYL